MACYSRSDRRHQQAREPLQIADKVALAARLGALRELAVLLDGLPLLCDEAERGRFDSQQPTTTPPVRPMPPLQCTAEMRPRRAFSLSTAKIWRTYDSERGRDRTWIGKEWYSTSHSSMLPMRETCGAYGGSSPLSVRSMNIRTPARSSISTFCECCARVNVQGYSHATSSGVAQYELGNGRGRMR